MRQRPEGAYVYQSQENKANGRVVGGKTGNKESKLSHREK